MGESQGPSRLVYSLIKERREGLESNVKDYNDLLTRLLQAQDSTQSRPKDNITGDTTVGSATGTANLKMSDIDTEINVLYRYYIFEVIGDTEISLAFESFLK